MFRRALLTSALVVVAATALVVPTLTAHSEHGAVKSDDCGEAAMYCPLSTADTLRHKLVSMPAPELQGPPPPAPAVTPKPVTGSVTYDVTTRGAITSDFVLFKTLANQTLNDNRGWRQLGVEFKEVSSGGQFTLVLSEASQVPTFSNTACDSYYSCRVGRYVIINQDRWQGATDTWSSAGGNLRDYRHMVINHETGHWLGHGHRGCPGAGQPAALMQQQSYDLQSCTFNPWPLSSELWSTTLGI